MYVRALSVFVVCLCCAATQGQLLNGNFLTPDYGRPNEWYSPPVYPPLHWDFYNSTNNLNYVGLHSAFIPQPEQTQTITWFIPGPVEGPFFVLLSTGDAQGIRSESLTEYSSIEQLITVQPGDVLSGYYFFGTCDYIPFDDTGLIELYPDDPNDGRSTITLASLSVTTLGNYQATDGWQRFQYQFGDNEQGQYLLYCEVRDVRDRIYKSYLALDNFRLCRGPMLEGDYTLDCKVDFDDFDLLTQGWLADCNDPNTVSDPNIPCHALFPDPNSLNNLILLEYLLPISENWLLNLNR